MKTIRKIRYLRMLRRQIRSSRRAHNIQIIPKFTYSLATCTELYQVLAKRMPLKIESSQMPSFKWPQTVKIVISGKKKQKHEAGLIPYDQQEEGVMHMEVPTAEFLQYSGDLDLSIAQMKLSPQQVQVPSFVQGYFQFRQRGIDFNAIEAVNLWYYKGNRLSTWHYDGHDNFLFMLQGKKVVHLSPPSNHIHKPKSIFNVNNNHSETDKEQSFLGKTCIKCDLNSGECLFIPRGWWHEVHSFGKPNVAINIWGNSFSKIVGINEEEAMLRHLIFTFSDRLSSKTASWGDMPEKMREKYRRANFQIYLNSSWKQIN